MAGDVRCEALGDMLHSLGDRLVVTLPMSATEDGVPRL